MNHSPQFHRAILAISGDLFLEMFRPGPRRVEYWVTAHGLPFDAVIVGVNYDVVRDEVELCIESNTLPGVDRGTRLPRLESPQITVTAEQWKAGQVETIIQAAVDPNPRREKLLTLSAALRGRL